MVAEPDEFQQLLDQIKSLDWSILTRRVDHQTFGIGVEQSIMKLLMALPIGSGFGALAGNSVVLYINRGAPTMVKIPLNAN